MSKSNITSEKPVIGLELIKKYIDDGNWSEVASLVRKWQPKEDGLITIPPDKNGTTVLHATVAGQCVFGEAHEEVIRSLLAQEVNINDLDYSLNTVLHYAGRAKNWKAIEWLVNNTLANVNAENTNGTTALHYVAQLGDLDTVELLVSKGANINAKRTDARTVLHCAAKGEKWDVVKWLVEEGANVNDKNKDGTTVLHYAAYRGNLDIFEFLVKKEANVKDKNANGHTALDCAVMGEQWGIVESLVNAGEIFTSLKRNAQYKKWLSSQEATNANIDTISEQQNKLNTELAGVVHDPDTPE